MNQQTTENTPEYIYVVNDVIPEVLPTTVAYRPAGRPELAERKIIKCPYCRGKLTDVERHTRVELYRKPKNKPIKPFPGQVYKQCAMCKGEVGIIMK